MTAARRAAPAPGDGVAPGGHRRDAGARPYSQDVTDLRKQLLSGALERARHGLTTRLRSDYAKLLSGTSLGQAAVVLTTPLVTRLYSPSQIGVFMVLVAYVGVAGYTTSWRLEAALVSERDDGRARSLLALCLALIVPMSALAALACLVLGSVGARGLGGMPPLAPVAVAGLLIVTSTFSVLRFWQVRAAQFSLLARGLTVQGFARALAPLPLALWRVDWIGLCCSEMLGRLAGIRSLGAAVLPQLRGAWRPSLWRALLRDYWKFPVLLMPSAVLDALAQNVAVPALALTFGASTAGNYALALRVGGTAVTLLAASAGDVLHARGAALEVSGRAAFVRREALRLARLGLVIFAPAALLAPWLAGPLLGPLWKDVGWMFALAAPSFWAMLVVGPLSRLLLVSNRIELKLVADVACLGLPLLALLLTAHLGIAIALAAMVGANLVAYAIYFLLIRHAVTQRPARGAPAA